MQRCFFILIFLFLNASVFAQTGTIIFPGVYGQQLLDNLVQDYKPNSVRSYNDARDAMYALIDNDNSTVVCVYSGYTITVPYGVSNPRSYTNGASPIINAEHTWPQSKGAGSGNPRSDMHHLFPTNERPNSGRGSLPFGEVVDTQTDQWYRNTTISPNVPSQFIDEYSELNNNSRFEVREDHKGNTARAMLYFYTMYKTEANQADPNFFNIQKDALRQWSNMDPVDAAEIARTNAIATYQDDKPNPFVLDTTLIGRAYFGVTVGLEPDENQVSTAITLHDSYPNPFNPNTTIAFELAKHTSIRLTIFDIQGKRIRTLASGGYPAGKHTFTWDAKDDQRQAVSSGIYFYQLEATASPEQIGRQTKKMFLIR